MKVWCSTESVADEYSHSIERTCAALVAQCDILAESTMCLETLSREFPTVFQDGVFMTRDEYDADTFHKRAATLAKISIGTSATIVGLVVFHAAIIPVSS